MALYSRDNARRSLIDTVAYRAISQVATALGYVVLVRGMTEQDFGVFNLLYAFIPFVSTFASLGLDQTLRRYQPEYLRSGNTAAAAWLVRLVASARFGTNVILLSLMLLGWNYFAPFFKLAPYKAEFAVFCVLVLLYFQASILQLSLASHMVADAACGQEMVQLVVLGQVIDDSPRQREQQRASEDTGQGTGSVTAAEQSRSRHNCRVGG